MKGPNLPHMAWRNLWRNRRRTILTLGSIAFGTFLAVLFTGLQDRSWAETIRLAARLGGGHVTLQHPEYHDAPSLTRTLDDAERLRQIALQDPDVERATSRITGETLLSTARQGCGALFIAYDPGEEDPETLSFLEGLVEGRMLESAREDGVVLGRRLAHNLNLRLDQKVVYTLVDREGEFSSGLARLRGVVATGARSIDSGLCLLPIGKLRQALGYAPREATQVAVFLTDHRRSACVAERLNRAVGPNAVALTWEDSQPQLAGFVAMKVGGGRVMEIIIALLVAAGIFNTIFVSVMERLREFGIMLAVGFSPGQLFRLVLWESFWLALTGLAAGVLLTSWPYYYLATKGLDMSALAGESTTEVAGIGMSLVMRVGIYPESAAVIAAAVVLATLAAGLYPAWRAGRVAPVDTIRLV